MPVLYLMFLSLIVLLLVLLPYRKCSCRTREKDTYVNRQTNKEMKNDNN